MRGSFVLGYLVAETALLVWFWSAFGTVALISLLLAGFLLGLLVMRIAGLAAFRSMREAQGRAAGFGVTAADGSTEVVRGPAPTSSDVQETAEDLGKSWLLFVAGILLALPGLICDAVGLVLLFPPVRARLSARFFRSARGSTASRTQVTVITVDEGGWTTQSATSTGSSAATRPPVIQGEILPPPGQEDQAGY